ncbi:hypothetical protein Tco_1124502 [Tanacetum coccineum]|uniref:Uncharacterized protein n=1 Tax=Tanacetum coccineum TaxID=301880 RepID=A0ABQ5J940_9ASTR
MKGTTDQNEGKSATQTAPTTTSTPTPTIFGDDETIAQVLIIIDSRKSEGKGKVVGNLRMLKILKTKANITRTMISLKLKRSLKCLLRMKRWPEKFKKNRKLKRKRKGKNKCRQDSSEELQKEEREKFTIEQKAKFLHDTIVAQRKFLAQQRSVKCFKTINCDSFTYSSKEIYTILLHQPTALVPNVDKVDEIIYKIHYKLEPRSDKESLEVEITNVEEVKSTNAKEVENNNVVIPVNVNEEEEKITDEVYELKQMEKRKIVEESRSTPFPTPIRSHRIHTDLVSLDTDKLQELTAPNTTSTPSSSSPNTKLSTTNRLLSLFKAKPARFK